jgi:hypothetical protein
MKPFKIYLSLSLIILITTFAWVTSCTHVADIANVPEVCFEGDVLPIFINSCAMAGCHDGGGGQESRLILNNYVDIHNTVVPGDPNASKSYQSIIGKGGEGRMPPGQPLSLDNRTLIRIWIEQGANLTTCGGTTTLGGGDGSNTGTTRACFTRDILPVIVSRCASVGCHDATTHAEGLIYISYSSTMTSVSPGNPSNSRLYQAIKTTIGEGKMPPVGKPQLSVAETDSIGKWIGYGALNETCGESCDTISPVTFSGTIWPILQSSCTGCHSGTAPSGNTLISSYNNVATIASSGVLLNSLKGAGIPKMPVGGGFSACRIRQFDIWIKAGFLNN